MPNFKTGDVITVNYAYPDVRLSASLFKRVFNTHHFLITGVDENGNVCIKNTVSNKHTGAFSPKYFKLSGPPSTVAAAASYVLSKYNREV